MDQSIARLTLRSIASSLVKTNRVTIRKTFSSDCFFSIEMNDFARDFVGLQFGRNAPRFGTMQTLNPELRNLKTVFFRANLLTDGKGNNRIEKTFNAKKILAFSSRRSRSRSNSSRGEAFNAETTKKKTSVEFRVSNARFDECGAF
jgi:hypothetical protein